MKFQITKGKTSKILTVFILDSSSTIGAGLAGLDQTSGIVGGYVREGSVGVALAVDENVTTEGTYQAPTTAGQIRIGTPANMRAGTYELHIHDDLLATGADALTITLGGATNMADLALEIQLTDFDLNLAIQPSNVIQLDGVAQSLLDLKDFADDGYDPVSNKVQGLVLCDLTTANTDMRGTDAALTSLGAADIDAGAFTQSKFGGSFIQSSSFATGALNAAAIASNAFTAVKFAAASLNGKGDWNIGKIDYTLTVADKDDIVDRTWDEPLSGHNIGGTTGKALKNAAGIVLRDGTLQAGSTASTAVLDSGASTLDDFFNHTRIVITSGTGAEQERIVSDYVGSTRTATITPDWAITPDVTSAFEILFGVAHAETVGGGYEGGQVWVDTVSGVAGTGLYVNGTIDNPVSNIADARTIADNLGLRMVHMLPGSSIILAQSFDNFEFRGAGFEVALGGQSVSGTRFFNAADITGIATGANRVFFQDCVINGATLPLFFARGCRIVGTMILSDAADYFFDLCFGGAAGSTLAIIDFGAAVGDTTVHMTHSANGFEFQNMGQAGTDILIMDGLGQVTFNANCIGGTATFIGVFNLINNGSVAITEADIINVATDIKAKTDDLTFTKAKELDSNVQSVNDANVTGDGQVGTEWGP